MTVLLDTNTISLAEGNKRYAALRASVVKAGLLDRSYGYYFFNLLFALAGIAVSVYFMIVHTSLVSVALWAFAFSFFSVQLSGIEHDAGHRAIFKSTKLNDMVGLLCASILAMGYSSWRLKHNLHHAHTNEEDEDPDIDLPILSFTKEHYRAKTGLEKLLVKYQAFIYYPMGVLVSFSVRLTSIQYFIKEFKKKYIGEMIVLALGLVAMYILPFYFFSFAKALTLLLVINVTEGFYLLNVFAPNHKGMPIVKKGKKLSFLEQQILTSRNIRGNPVTDFVYLGLNYQIEHHLFPDCPRNKLHRLSEHIKQVCRELKLEYTEVGILESNKIILSELHTVARTS